MLKNYRWRGSSWQFEESKAPQDAVEIIPQIFVKKEESQNKAAEPTEKVENPENKAKKTPNKSAKPQNKAGKQKSTKAKGKK